MKLSFAIIVTMAAMFAMAALLARAAEAPTTPAAQSGDEAKYEAALEKRGDDVLKALKLDDPDKATRVKQSVIAQYRAIRDIDEKVKAIAKDDKAAVAKAKEDAAAAKKPLHDEFVAKLSKDLAPEQIETVKDKMTMGRLEHDFGGFSAMLPQLTDAQKNYILSQLKEAREVAMDQGSAEEKHAVFNKTRGKINNYLSTEGYDLKQASKDWAERRKAATTQAEK